MRNGVCVFLTDDKLLNQFESRLKTAARVDLAAAWATDGPGLTALAKAARGGVQVRALIGLDRNITTPTALDRLKQIGELRVVRGSRLFHPKVYVFHGSRGGFAWVGSANFTGKGLNGRNKRLRNEEAMLETQAIGDISDWFRCRWEEAGELDERVLEGYRKEYEQRPPDIAVDEQLPDEADEEAPEHLEFPVATRGFLEPISAWGKANPSRRLPPTAYIPAILRTLDAMGGSATRREALKRVHEMMDAVLRPIDRDWARKDHERNWEHQCDVARQKMAAHYGLVRPTADTGDGKWGLTSEGKKASKGNYGTTWQRFAKKAEAAARRV